MFYQKPICTDDFGSLVYKGHYTGIPVPIQDAVTVGAMLPGLKARYFDIIDHQSEKKFSQQCFNENDANCNTCKHLQRVKHEKNSAGFLYGKCAIDSKEPRQYPTTDGVMMFHPDDYAGMECWEAR
jgi:hypothetical protein